MPNLPKRPCRYPGCPNLVTTGMYCEEHQPLMDKQNLQYNQASGFNRWHSQAYGSKWKRIRDHYVSAHPLCERCAKRGRYVRAEDVHHIKPVRDGGTNEWDNLMSLCHRCHMELHAEMKKPIGK